MTLTPYLPNEDLEMFAQNYLGLRSEDVDLFYEMYNSLPSEEYDEELIHYDELNQTLWEY